MSAPRGRRTRHDAAVHEPPTHVADSQVLVAVRQHWLPDVDAVQHLAVGFGAHHWAASVGGARRLFVTLDALGERHDASSLEGAYAGAASFHAGGLGFVLAPVRSAGGTFTALLGDDALSATPWQDGTTGSGPHRDAVDARAWARRLFPAACRRPPVGVPRWRPLVTASLGQDLSELCSGPWPGPYGEQARTTLLPRLDDVAAWTGRCLSLAATTDPAGWVPTHGEPHTRNLLRTADGDLLVDWESLKVAPRERDLAALLVGAPGWQESYEWPAVASGPDPLMVEVFDLKWRLDEIAQYAALFAAPHPDDEDTRTALGGFRHELGRPPRPTV